MLRYTMLRIKWRGAVLRWDLPVRNLRLFFFPDMMIVMIGSATESGFHVEISLRAWTIALRMASAGICLFCLFFLPDDVSSQHSSVRRVLQVVVTLLALTSRLWKIRSPPKK